ncbi:S53 family peptidase [Burkholderia multivorans]|uniref:S53 family peptidase n=1 Tax=Burkholderia multivorans TaxID=87883 RepID=UPI0009E0D825|nr:S53 family peptidase [Burkholderia multivorans]MCA8500067.1 S53 family peptidase [Burkholderia multivorans]MDN8078397.1 S53 family peptidase [Burkholderia multivorans]SAJ91403.1 peptidase S53 propeptide [Burkholderia multivorans]SAJ91734.1 peptidase S53 propeptide [Burkholderia multivorans]HEF4779887.1 S8/S53 family peptidase [Burkholderia multivorans]
MKRNVRFALPLPSPRRIAYAWPLLVAAGAAHAATDWVDTHTKAFLTGPQLMARSAASSLELAAGETTDVVVSLKLRNADQLKQLARDVNRPGSARYRQYLTPERFLADYAPTEMQVKAVVDYLRKSGFVNIEVAPNRLLVSARGTAGTVKTAFNTSLVRFQYAGRSGFANASTAQVPRALGDVVGSVLGLQNVARARPMLRIGNVSKPQTLAAGTATGHYPKEFPGLYNATGVPTAAGVTVGIITIGGVSQTLQDLKRFASSNGYATVATQTVKTNGTGTSGSYADDPDGQGEWDLDSQSIVGAAGGQVGKLVFYMADLNAPGNTGLTQAFNRAVSDNTAKVINVSLGWCETDANADGTLDAEEQIFTTAAAQGQTFSVSSGDEGVYECNNRGYPDGANYTVSWPASSPHVLAIGGTTLYTTSAGAFSSETVWNEGLDSNGKLWATGGGVSTLLPAPAWQSGSNRRLPDVSFDAAQSTGAYIYNYGQLQQIGGTSLAAPIFTGFWARLLAANGAGLGFPAANLYRAIPANPSLVRYDVVSGNNGYQGYGYTAGTGWDYPTGFGSLNIANLNKLIQSGGF